MNTAKKTSKRAPVSHGVGRRKSSVARVWLRPGSGEITVNGRDAKVYFTTDFDRIKAAVPFVVTPAGKHFDVDANINGGGLTAQAGALSLGISRALVAQDEELRPTLRQHGLLTCDSRVKERKKYGQRGARRKFQFVKR